MADTPDIDVRITMDLTPLAEGFEEIATKAAELAERIRRLQETDPGPSAPDVSP